MHQIHFIFSNPFHSFFSPFFPFWRIFTIFLLFELAYALTTDINPYTNQSSSTQARLWTDRTQWKICNSCTKSFHFLNYFFSKLDKIILKKTKIPCTFINCSTNFYFGVLKPESKLIGQRVKRTLIPIVRLAIKMLMKSDDAWSR